MIFLTYPISNLQSQLLKIKDRFNKEYIVGLSHLRKKIQLINLDLLKELIIYTLHKSRIFRIKETGNHFDLIDFFKFD